MQWRCLRQTDRRNHISGPRELKGYYALVKQQPDAPKVTGSQVITVAFYRFHAFVRTPLLQVSNQQRFNHPHPERLANQDMTLYSCGCTRTKGANPSHCSSANVDTKGTRSPCCERPYFIFAGKHPGSTVTRRLARSICNCNWTKRPMFLLRPSLLRLPRQILHPKAVLQRQKPRRNEFVRFHRHRNMGETRPY